MSSADTYDVAVVGYGPTGATAANLLGQLGLKVVVIERDPDIYSRARAISTDEEAVLRVWQSVGQPSGSSATCCRTVRSRSSTPTGARSSKR